MASFPADSVRTKTWGEELLTSADLHTQFDVLHSYIQAALNSTSGHAHTGAANQGPKLSPANMVIASQAAGDVLYASSSTAWARLAKGTAGQVLQMNSGATAPAWASGTTQGKPVVLTANSHAFTVSGVTTAPTVGATYTNNSITFTVISTTADKLTVYATGTGNSEASGTLTKTAGTGDDTITFSSVCGVLPAVDGSALKGVATVGESIKGWINFNGTGTIAIRDSYNVSGITDNNTGDYTVTWDTDFADANYCCVVTGGGTSATEAYVAVASQAAGSVNIVGMSSSGNARDHEIVNVMAIGDR